MPYMKDAAGRRLDDIQVSDAAFGHYDASLLDTADGSTLRVLQDLTGRGNDLVQFASSLRPVVKTDGPNGNRYVRFAGGSGGPYLKRAAFGSGWNAPAGYAQPNTIILVARASSIPGTVQQVMLGGTVPGGRHNLLMTNGSASLTLAAGASSTAIGGPRVNDDAWHIWTCVFGTADYAIYRDGYLVAAGATQAQGPEPFAQATLGAAVDGSSPARIDVGELIFRSGRIETSALDALTASLASKWGITDTGANTEPVWGSYVDTTAGDASPIRVWAPRAGASKWILWSHPHGQTEQATPGYWAYPLFHALVNEGYGIIASRQNGGGGTSDTWGNDTALTAVLAMHTYVAANFGTPTDVVLAGGSMGGLPSLLAAAGQTVTVPNVRGVFLVDGVTNLAALFANATYTASIRTAYGIAGDDSDYASKTANHDPNLKSASAFPAIRYRFYASATDAAVGKAANADAMTTKLTGRATEVATVATLGGHLSAININSSDTVAFVKRCFDEA